MTMKNYYIMNRETQKLELHFEKSFYMDLPEEQKKKIKSNFLFSRYIGGWISRAKFPNLYWAEQVAKEIGLIDAGKTGESLTFAEQMERKAEKAEARAERYDHKAGTAQAKAEALQKPLNDMRGDNSFFTQPNINSSSGRAFTSRREKMFKSYEKGFEEFKKSEYYAERAEAARQTMKDTKPTDKGFIDRRIKEAEKTIKAQRKNLENYKQTLYRINNGEEIKRYNGDNITAETVEKWIENAETIIENAISKSVYYHQCLDDLGGVEFSPDNIQVGYIVKIARWGNCRVISKGKVNITYEIINGGATGFSNTATYAEIEKIISTDIQAAPKHPFKVGDIFTVDEWNMEKCKSEKKEYKVIKITDKKVTLKSSEERAKTRTPRRFRENNINGGYCWALGIVDGLNGTVYKRESEAN